MARLLVVLACLAQAMIAVQAFVVRPAGPVVRHGVSIQSVGSSSSSSPRARQAPRMIGDLFSLFGGNSEPQGIPRSIKDGVNALRFATQRAVRPGPPVWSLARRLQWGA